MSRLKIEAAALSDIGLVRKRNEDNFFFNGGCIDSAENGLITGVFSAEKAVFAVCDGMGGIDSGDTASRLSVQAMSGINREITAENMGQKLKERIKSANDVLCSAMKKSKKRMGSTMAAVAITEGQLCTANVGDSRVYAFKNGELKQLTVDHTEAQFLVNSGLITLDEAQKHPHRNRLTQHLGLFPDEILIEPYISENVELTEDTEYLICSDGLYSMMDEESIKNIMANGASAREQCQAFVQASVDNGGKDNVTVIVLHIKALEEDEETEDFCEAEESEQEEEMEKLDFLKQICNSNEKKFFIIRYIILVVVLAIVFTCAAVAMNKNIDKRVGPDGRLVYVEELKNN